MITPYPDQIEFTNKIIGKIADKYTRILAQLATGGGKTVVFSYLISRYLTKSPAGKVIILVHRRRLKSQTEATLRAFGLLNVRVEMVETFNNQIKKHPVHYDMLIADECHRAEFVKIIDHYKPTDTIILGFSATPISSNKKRPLKSIFQTIVVGTEINQLIKMKRLCPAIHHDIEQEIGKIAKSGHDYNMGQMGVEFSKPKLVQGVVDAYRKYADGKKALVFNTTIEHSQKVNHAFIEAGYPSRCIDSKNYTDEEIQQVYDWVRDTPGAIMNSVEMATTGYDDPTIEAVLHNYKTCSLPKWLQCGGRGGRVLTKEQITAGMTKPYFINIDLGGMIESEGFGHWNERHDWEYYFNYPEKAGKGVAPMKKCPKCDARIYMSSTLCIWCGHEMPRVAVYTDMVVKLRLVPEKGVKPNDHSSLMATIEQAAARVKNVPVIGINERKELMFYAFKEIYEQSSFEPRAHIISHLVSVYGK